ncbi:MAG: ribosome maturation factor RimP [Candidatus Latescibacteria bacterium]|nr:ribosome maturation factor RimP [Candidatus Latescibacterota bacterium]
MGVRDRRLKTIRQLLEGLLGREGMELVELKVGQRGREVLITLFIDRPGGVALGDCAHITREAMDLFDMENLFEGAYSLEVSSPGLNRPLRSERDFERALGREIHLTMKEGVIPPERSGLLLKVQNRNLTIEHEDEQIEIALEEVREGKIAIQF